MSGIPDIGIFSAQVAYSRLVRPSPWVARSACFETHCTTSDLTAHACT